MTFLRQRLRPAEVVAYLRTRGWEVADDGYDQGALWEKVGDEATTEVFVPMAEDAPDYNQELTRLLVSLADLERRDSLYVAREIKESVGDVIRFRVVLGSGDSSRLPLALAPTVFKAAHDVTISAANAVRQRRPFYKKWTNEVHDFARQAEVGQTEPGSYVVRVLCPLTHVPQPQLQLKEEEPFGRRVTDTLDRALAASLRTSRMAITKGDLSVFDSTVAEGVSSNLCRALASVGDAQTTTLEIRMRWAQLRGHARPAESRHYFGPDTLEVLQSAADHLRDQEEERIEHQIVRGFITKCERGASATSGTVVVEGWAEGEFAAYGRLKCKAQLSGKDYELAVNAHAQRVFVSLHGTIHRVGRSWTMENVDELRVEDAGE